MKTTIETYPGVGNNTEINRRDRAAQAYRDSIKAKKREKAEGNIYFAITILIIFLTLVAGIIVKAILYPNDNGKGHYEYTSETQSNGDHYIYIQE